jgi:hypothetical protein
LFPVNFNVQKLPGETPLETLRRTLGFTVGQEYGLHLQYSLEEQGDEIVSTGCPLVDNPFLPFGDEDDSV